MTQIFVTNQPLHQKWDISFLYVYSQFIILLFCIIQIDKWGVITITKKTSLKVSRLEI